MTGCRAGAVQVHCCRGCLHGSSAEQATAVTHVCDWYRCPLPLFLVLSHLYISKLCQSLGRVKLRWAVHGMPWEIGEAGCSCCSPFPNKRKSLGLIVPCWHGAAVAWANGMLHKKWNSSHYPFFGSFLRLLAPLCSWSFLSGVLSSPRMIFSCGEPPNCSLGGDEGEGLLLHHLGMITLFLKKCGKELVFGCFHLYRSWKA